MARDPRTILIPDPPSTTSSSLKTRGSRGFTATLIHAHLGPPPYNSLPIPNLPDPQRPIRPHGVRGNESARHADAHDGVSLLLGIGAAARDGHGPVVLGDGCPEDPDEDDGQEGEEGGEHAAVDGAAGAGADVARDDVLENLGDGEEDAGADEVDWEVLLAMVLTIVSWCSAYALVLSRPVLAVPRLPPARRR